MRQQQANTDFSDVHVENRGTLGMHIYNSMVLEPGLFGTPTVPLDDVKKQAEDYIALLALPEYPAKSADLDKLWLVLMPSLKKNAMYVNSVAVGDLSILLRSGYPLSKVPAPVGPLPGPNAVTVKPIDDKEGEFDITAETVDHAKGYLFAHAPDTNTDNNPYNWTIRWSSSRSCRIKGCASGTKYKFAAAGVGSDDTINFTHAGKTYIAQ